jgi:hypothetical protein
MKSFREIRDAIDRDSTPRQSRRSHDRFGYNAELAVRAYENRDGQAVVGSGAHEPMDRPGHFYGESPSPRRPGLVNGRTPTYTDRNKCGPTFISSIEAATPVQHTSNKGDIGDIGRGKPITY